MSRSDPATTSVDVPVQVTLEDLMPPTEDPDEIPTTGQRLRGLEVGISWGLELLGPGVQGTPDMSVVAYRLPPSMCQTAPRSGADTIVSTGPGLSVGLIHRDAVVATSADVRVFVEGLLAPLWEIEPAAGTLIAHGLAAAASAPCAGMPPWLSTTPHPLPPTGPRNPLVASENFSGHRADEHFGDHVSWFLGTPDAEDVWGADLLICNIAMRAALRVRWSLPHD